MCARSHSAIASLPNLGCDLDHKGRCVWSPCVPEATSRIRLILVAKTPKGTKEAHNAARAIRWFAAGCLLTLPGRSGGLFNCGRDASTQLHSIRQADVSR